MSRKLASIIVLLSLLAFVSGCAVISSHSNTRITGTPVSDETLDRIELGVTSQEWIMATLGQPTRIETVDESTGILKYTSKRITHSDAGLLFIFDTSSKSEETSTVYFEFIDGVLQRYWQDSE